MATAGVPFDSMDRRNGYTELMSGFEDMKVKRQACIDGIVSDTKEIKDIEKRIRELKKDWKGVNKALAKDLIARNRLDKTLSELDVDGLSDEAKALKVQQAFMTVEEYAASLRKEMEADVKASEARAKEEHGQQEKAIEDAVRKAGEKTFPGDSQRLPVIAHTPRLDHGHEAVTVTNVKAKIEDSEGVERSLPVRCYRSSASDVVSHLPAGVSPATLVYFHGDGYVTGSLNTHDWLCRTLAASAGVVVASIGYRQPPEHRFPAAFDDCFGALEWVAEGGLAKSGKPPVRLAVGGDSAGGGLAAACCLRAREEGPKIALQILFYPWLDLRPDSPIMKSELADGRFSVRREALDWLIKAYAPRSAKEAEVKPKEDVEKREGDSEDEEDPPMDEEEAEARLVAKQAEEDARAEKDEREKWIWASDVRASPILMESAKGLPKTFLAYLADDPISHDAIKYAGRLKSENNDPKILHMMRLKGPHHGFIKFPDRPEAMTVLSAAAAYASAVLNIL